MEFDYEGRTDINSKLPYAVLRTLELAIELYEEEGVFQEHDLQGRDLVRVIRLLREKQSDSNEDERNDDKRRDEKCVSSFGRVIDLRLVRQPRRGSLMCGMMVQVTVVVGATVLVR